MNDSFGGFVVMEMSVTLRPVLAEPPARRNLFSSNGQWIAFITGDDAVWTPTGTLIGRAVNDDVFGHDGVYLGTINGDRLEFCEERRLTRAGTEPSSPSTFPGYPGVPTPTLIRPAQKVSTLV
jgi:hypothetical protein